MFIVMNIFKSLRYVVNPSIIVCLLITFSLVSCGKKIVDTSNVEELVKGFYEAISEGDADLLKQTRHINFISLKTLKKFESGDLFDEDGRKDSFSNIRVTSVPKLYKSTESGFKYKLFDYKLRMGLKFESQKAYHKFLKEVYPALRDDPDIEGLKAEGWVKGVSISKKFQGMSFWDAQSEKWYFCLVDRYDIYNLKEIISDKEYRAVRSKLRL